MNLKRLLFFSLITLMFFSCKSTKVKTIRERKQLEIDSIFTLVEKNQFNAEWLTAKLKGVYHMKDGKKSFNGQMRIKQDSIIWFSVYAVMNIEIFRLEIKADSFKFINRLEKSYLHEDIEYFKNRFDVDLDFEMLQAIILGNDFPFYETDVFKYNDNPNSFILSTVGRKKLQKFLSKEENNSKILEQSIWIDRGNYRIRKQNVKVVGQDRAKLTVKYDNFKKVNNKLFPAKMTLKMKEDDNTFIELFFNNIEINESLSFPFKIPSKYKNSKEG